MAELNDTILEGFINEDYGDYAIPTEQDLETGNMVTLYRVAFKNQLESLFKYGYDREFTGTKGGNMYGAGVYCTNKLSDSIHNVKTKPEYGDCIVKMYLIGGYDKFIIFSEDWARSQYGKNWMIQNQIKLLIKDESIADEMIRKINQYCRQEGLNPYHGRTAPIAYFMTSRYMRFLKANGVRGIIYKGNRDGHCSLPYDFGAVIPYSVSFDQGKTFKKMFNSDTLNRMTKSCDSSFRYGQKYDNVWKPVNGYCMVEKGGKYNYVEIENDEEVSPIWFDYCSMINAENGHFTIVYNGIKLLADPWGVLDTDGEPWFDFENLQKETEEIKRRRAARGQR